MVRPSETETETETGTETETETETGTATDWQAGPFPLVTASTHATVHPPLAIPSDAPTSALPPGVILSEARRAESKDL